MLDIAQRLFSNWNSHNLLYCHWKSNQHLEEGLQGLTDLDVLVALDHKRKCASILRNLDFIKCQPQYGSCYPGVEDWLGCDTPTGRLVHIHLHYQIVTGHKGLKEYNLPWTGTALATRVRDDHTGVYIMEPNLELMTLYTRIALKASARKIYAARKGAFNLDESLLKEMIYLKRQINLQTLEDFIKTYYGPESLLQDLIARESLTAKEFLLLHAYVTKKMRPYRTTNALLALGQKNYYRLVLPARNILRSRFKRLLILKKTPLHRGLTIAFIGQDGSGKSTVTNEIVEWLTWKLDAHKFYLGSGRHFHSWQKTLQKKINKKRAVPTMLSALLTLSNHLAVAKRTYRSVKQGKKYALNGGIAVFDRYPQTSYWGINDGPKIRFNYASRVYHPLLKKFILYCAQMEEKYYYRAAAVTPEIVFKLILPPEISIIRKPEDNLSTIKEKHEIVKKLSFEQSRVYSIDAGQEYPEEIKEIKRIIWGNLLKHK